MDDDLKQHLKDLFLLDDIMREDNERWEREHGQRKGELRYRTQENAMVQKQADETADEAGFITFTQLEEVVGIIADEMAGKIAELEAAIADLRNQRGNVTPIKRGRADVA